mgnify:FL=1
MTTSSPENQVKSKKTAIRSAAKKPSYAFCFWIVLAILTALSFLINWKIGAVVVTLVINTYAFVFLMMELGKRNIFWTMVDEGQAKGVTIFGRVSKCLMAYTAHRFNAERRPDKRIHKDSRWDIRKLKPNKTRPEEKRTWFWVVRHILGIDLGGLKWVGIWPFYQIYRYNFRWTSLRGQMPTDDPGTDYKYEETRSRVIDYILVRQETYLIDLKGIEDEEQLSVDIKLVWTNQVVNPFRALFRVRNWLETSTDRLLTHIRREFSVTTWKEFQKGDDLRDKLQTILGQIKDKYGVETVGLEIIDLKPPEEFKAAAEKIRMAQAEVDVARHTAEAAVHEAATIITKAEAEAGRVRKVMLAAIELGDNAVAMKIAEDLSKGGGQVTIIGSAANSLVRDLLGKKETEK